MSRVLLRSNRLAVLAVSVAMAALVLSVVPALGADEPRPENGNASRTVSKAALQAPTVSGVTLFAVVKADGTLVRGSNVRSSRHVDEAAYSVIFDLNVRPCAYTATIGKVTHMGKARPGEITTVGRAGEPRGVYVTTSRSNGDPANRPFHLMVSC
jgi:hypothetical protein